MVGIRLQVAASVVLRLLLPCLVLWLPAGCAEEKKPTWPNPGSKTPFYLEVMPFGAVFIEDSTHCTVAEGDWKLYWRLRRAEPGSPATVRIATRDGSARAGEDFEPMAVRYKDATGDTLLWDERAVFEAIRIKDDNIPEPDEEFVIVLDDTTSGIGSDDFRLHVTIVDDDQPWPGGGTFSWPLEPGTEWRYRVVYEHWTWGPVGLGTFGETVRAGAPRVFKGESFSPLTLNQYASPWLVRPDGSVFEFVRNGNLADPPPAYDTLATGTWRAMPFRIFDAASPNAPSQQAYTARSSYWWLTESSVNLGPSAIATPAGVFRRVLRIKLGESMNYSSYPLYEGEPPVGGWRWLYVADSVGIVAEVHNEWSPGPDGGSTDTSVHALSK